MIISAGRLLLVLAVFATPCLASPTAGSSKNQGQDSAQSASPSSPATSRPRASDEAPALRLALLALATPGGLDDLPADDTETAFSHSVNQHLSKLITQNPQLRWLVQQRISGKPARAFLVPPIFSKDQRDQRFAALCQSTDLDMVLGAYAPGNPGGHRMRTVEYSLMYCSDTRLYRKQFEMHRALSRDQFGYQTAISSSFKRFLNQARQAPPRSTR